jgi:hypothetical protein
VRLKDVGRPRTQDSDGAAWKSKVESSVIGDNGVLDARRVEVRGEGRKRVPAALEKEHPHVDAA